MKEIIIANVENEQIKKLFETFFVAIQISLDIKDKHRNMPFYKRKPDKNLRSLIENKEALQSKDFDLFVKSVLALEKNQAYLDTTEWKVLTLLSHPLVLSQNPSAVYEALDYLKQFEFLGENNFSVIKVASIIYSLTQSEPLDAAKILVRLHYFKLLTEQNLGKISNYPELNNQLFSSVLNKLSLIDGDAGTSHLLNQANLDKLIKNPELNLAVWAKFLQAEDKSKILTQEKFDLAINLKNLLTDENITKIEKAAFDSKELADVLFLLDKADILTQDNFDSIINLEEMDRAKSVLSKFSGSNILGQEQFSQFLAIYNKAKVFDNQNNSSDSKDDFSDLLIDRLCAAFLKVKVLTKNICKIIVEFFTNKINLHTKKQAEVKTDLATNYNSSNFFEPVLSRKYSPSTVSYAIKVH